MKFPIKDFFSKCDQIRSFLKIWSHLPKKSLLENFILCSVYQLNCACPIVIRVNHFQKKSSRDVL